MNNKATAHLTLLGLMAKDKITGLRGYITSVSFDLFGCIQVIINPGISKDGELIESIWFDINRVEILHDPRVMPVPDFEHLEEVSLGQKGPEIKPVPR